MYTFYLYNYSAHVHVKFNVTNGGNALHKLSHSPISETK